jgi:hypothetical protein
MRVNKKNNEPLTAVWRNGGCSASYGSFVVGSSAVLRLNFCAKNQPPSPIRKPLPASVEDQPNHQQTTKNGRQFRCNLTQTVLASPTLNPMHGFKNFPSAHLKNNFDQPHIGTFTKPHEPTHNPSLTKKPIPKTHKNISDKNIHYSKKVLIFAQIKSRICFQKLVNTVLELQFSLQSNPYLIEK